LRRICVEAIPTMLQLTKIKKVQILKELNELLDDEEPTIRLGALKCLPESLQACSPTEIAMSEIIDAVTDFYHRSSTMSADFRVLLAEISVKIIHALPGLEIKTLLDEILEFYKVSISTQDRCTK